MQMLFLALPHCMHFPARLKLLNWMGVFSVESALFCPPLMNCEIQRMGWEIDELSRWGPKITILIFCYSLPLSLLDLQVGKAFSRRKKNEGGVHLQWHTDPPASERLKRKRHARKRKDTLVICSASIPRQALSLEQEKESKKGTIYKSELAPQNLDKWPGSARSSETVLFSFPSQQCWLCVLIFGCVVASTGVGVSFSSGKEWNSSGSTYSSCLHSPPSLDYSGFHSNNIAVIPERAFHSNPSLRAM